MIAVVDYGLGNVQAFVNIYNRLNVKVGVARSGEDLTKADRAILPGVGSFDWAMSRLERSGMRPSLQKFTQDDKRPILGVCVGMQMMASRSDEGQLEGLGWIDGEVKRFDDTLFSSKTHLPHMGWNDVTPAKGSPLFQGFAETPRFYFLHSYYFSAARTTDVLATTDYEGAFPSAVHAGNVYGVQFHPEKSHHWGIQLLKNFAEL